jgi:hypothetical protein
MMEQTSMFGDPKKLDRHLPKNPTAADEKRTLYLTCWENCYSCDPVMLEQKHKNPKRRLYRLCTNTERLVDPKCFVDCVICERVERRSGPRQVDLTDPDWADY